MGQCGCGDYCPDRLYETNDGVFSLQLYRGCSQCEDTIFVVPDYYTHDSIFVQGVDWCREKIEPSDDGALLQGIPVIGVDDLRAAFAKHDAQGAIEDPDGYATIDDFLHDEGLRILQDAMQMCAERMKG